MKLHRMPSIVMAFIVLGASSATAAPSGAAKHLVDATLAGLSAGRPIESVTTVEATGREIQQDLVENDHPMTAPFYVASDVAVKRVDDLDRLVERTVADGTATSLQSANLAVAINPKTGARRVAAPSPGWMLHNPIVALRLAAKALDLRAEPDMIWHGARQHVVSFHYDRYPVHLSIDAATGLPTAVEVTVDYDPLAIPSSISLNALGDMTERSEYLNWVVTDGIRYPMQHDLLRDGQLQRTLSIRELALNTPLDATGLELKSGEALPHGSVQDLRPDQKVPGPYPNKPIAEIAPGVVQIPNSWYATIVRQPDGLVIIDAPISAGYSKGVLAEAERRFPGVRIKALVTSTGFFWHVAGVREYAARGIPIYAERRNVPVIERMLHAPHRLSPDDLSRHAGAKLTVIPVDGPTVIGTGANAIELYPVAQATQPMVMSYIRDAKLLHTAEMVQPLGPGGSILFPESLIELTHTVKADGIDVTTMIGMHMSPTPWSEVARTLAVAHAAA